MTATLIIKNNYKTNRKISLLDWVMSGSKPNIGLPKNISVTVRITHDDGYFKDVNYKEFLNSIVCNRIIVAINKTTNNRQLYFHQWNPWGNLPQIQPLRGYKGEWNPKNHNIADTNEKFFLDGKQVIKINLKANQKFEIEFKIFSYCHRTEALGSHRTPRNKVPLFTRGKVAKRQGDVKNVITNTKQ